MTTFRAGGRVLGTVRIGCDRRPGRLACPRRDPSGHPRRQAPECRHDRDGHDEGDGWRHRPAGRTDGPAAGVSHGPRRRRARHRPAAQLGDVRPRARRVAVPGSGKADVCVIRRPGAAALPHEQHGRRRTRERRRRRRHPGPSLSAGHFPTSQGESSDVAHHARACRVPARPVHAVRRQPDPHAPGRRLGVRQRLQPGCRREGRQGRAALPRPRRRHRFPRRSRHERRRHPLRASPGAGAVAQRALRGVRLRGPEGHRDRRDLLPDLQRLGPHQCPAVPGHLDGPVHLGEARPALPGLQHLRAQRVGGARPRGARRARSSRPRSTAAT